MLAEHIKRTYAGHELAVVSPDSGRVRLAERWADTLGGTPLAFIHKTRDPRDPTRPWRTGWSARSTAGSAW